MDDGVLLDLAQELGEALKARQRLLVLAESCTGGMVAQYVTAIAGSSAWFDRAYISYSNTAKQDMLGVSTQTLEAFGAVSEQVAAEMALGALENSSAQISAAISGIAGPDGGTESKPVGTVCFGFACNKQTGKAAADIKAMTQTRHFSGNRDAIRRQAATHALETLITLTLSLDL
jgi:nicotinamide-nucleotide amidase